MASEILLFGKAVLFSPFIGAIIVSILAFLHYSREHKHDTGSEKHKQHEEHGGIHYTKFENVVSTFGILSIFVSWFFMVLIAIKYLPGEEHEPLTSQFGFFGFKEGGTPDIPFGVLIDPLSVYMGLIVTTLALLIHIYAREYMHGDAGYARFFATFNFFTGVMLTLVFSTSFLELFIFWELVGLSSYLLIGFWFYKPTAAHAAKKAFLYNKIGDITLLAGFLMLYRYTRTLDFVELPAKMEALSDQQIAIIAVLIFGGVIGKSAQFPLYTWLADAMEGPTPVSAILHSSTMVKAGIYMVARVFFIYYEAKDGHNIFAGAEWALIVFAWIGAITALLAGLQALVENEIKRILAYSTVSQIGYMAIALGTGGKTAAMYHLLSHATFKALLFLTAGAVIHAVHTNNIWEMGGLRKKIPKTFWPMLIGATALAGFPGFSGFWSKDAVLLAAYESEVPGHLVVYYLGALTAFITALYSTRFIYVVFFRTPDPEHKEHVEKAHDGGFFLTTPSIILGALVIIESILFIPVFNFEHWLSEILQPEIKPEAINYMVAGSSGIIVLLGIFVGLVLYHWKPELRTSLYNIAAFNWFANEFVAKRYRIDQVLYWIANVPVMWVAGILQSVDLKIIDRTIIDTWIVKGSLQLAKISDVFDQGFIDGIVNGVWQIFLYFGRQFRKFQTGLVSNYATIFAATLVLFLTYVNFLVLFK